MKDSNRSSSFLQSVNKTLVFIDNTVDRMGIWYKIIFTYFWSIVAVYCSIQVLIPAISSASRSSFIIENQYIASVVAMGLFIIVLVYKPKVATVIEVILCSLCVLIGISQKMNLLWFSVDAGLYLYLGMAFCGGLIAGEIFWLIVKKLRRYRRRHMKRRIVPTMDYGYYGAESEQWLTTVNLKKPKGVTKKNSLDQDGFIITKSNIKTGGKSMPDSSGFIIERSDDKD